MASPTGFGVADRLAAAAQNPDLAGGLVVDVLDRLFAYADDFESAWRCLEASTPVDGAGPAVRHYAASCYTAAALIAGVARQLHRKVDAEVRRAAEVARG